MSNLHILSVNSGDFWLKMGFQHLLDFNGYDHMLFLWMSFLAFRYTNYKRAFLNVSLFTLAHSLTLAISVFKWVPITSDWIERLIALSIAISAVIPLILNIQKTTNNLFAGVLIFVFGLIHGMGFSGLLLSLLGHSENIVAPLLFFNLGLELGQLLFVSALLSIQTVLHKYLREKQNIYIRVSSFIGLCAGIYLFLTRF